MIHRPGPASIVPVFLALCIPAAGAAAGENDAPPMLRVQGEAEVSVAPDLATVRLGATVQAHEAAVAQRQVNEILRRTIERIQALNVSPENVQTAQLTLGPVYSSPRPPSGGEDPSEPRITGYRAASTVAVRLHDLSRVGPVVDAGVASGANELQGVHFGLRNDLEPRMRALRAATEEAQRKARALAEAAGVRLAGVRLIQEGGAMVLDGQPDLRLARMAEASGAPVEPGQVRVRASVTMSFDIAPSSQRPP